MPVIPDSILPGQESVWTFPRPSIAQATARHLRIEHRGIVVAEARRGVRTIETSHPPTYYFPAEDVHAIVTPSDRPGSFCEWKGAAVYFDVTVGGETLREAAWSYPAPTPPFAAIAGYLAFYASAFETPASSTTSASYPSPAASTAAGSPAISPGRLRACRAAGSGNHRELKSRSDMVA